MSRGVVDTIDQRIIDFENDPSSKLGLAPTEVEAIWAYLKTLDGTDGI